MSDFKIGDRVRFIRDPKKVYLHNQYENHFGQLGKIVHIEEEEDGSSTAMYPYDVELDDGTFLLDGTELESVD